MLRLLTILTAASLVGCAAMSASQDEIEGDDPFKHGHLELSRSGRYTPSASARAAGEAQYGSYESAGPYNGGRGCSDSFTGGARALGDYLTTNFGATRYDGYTCRPNSANRSELSMHGTGRAIDVYVPLVSGQADNDLGDPIANWLIENATDIGVQFFIWDRTKWNISYTGTKDRSYGGAHPHHDHLHIELSRAGGARETAWFGGASSPAPDSPADEPGTDPSGGTSEPAPATGSGCTDTCPYAGDGECDDGGPSSLYSLCDFGTDCRDCGRRSVGGSTPAPEPEPAPAPAPADTACTDTCPYAGDGECDDGGAGAAYSVCALGTDCTDCGPRAGSSGSMPLPDGGGSSTTIPHAGVELDGMTVPRQGLANPTLERALGVSHEPVGRVVVEGGVQWVRGSISWFGGPTDTGVSSTETGAVTGENLRGLNSPMNPSAAAAAADPEEYYFAAMRWNYSPRGVTWLRSARLVVRNPTTGATIVVRPVDWGPHTRTGRAIDLSPQALRDLGLSTDDDVLIAWAPQSTRLGVVR